MVPLLDPTRDILQKYEKYHDYNPKRTMLPIPTNQDCNRELKKIAAMAGIEKNVTFHMGRHTFATTITLMNDIPIETVSSMLGHAKENMKILHPLPRVNEIAYDVDTNPHAYYIQQAGNGLFAREAIFSHVLDISLEDVMNDNTIIK